MLNSANDVCLAFCLLLDLLLSCERPFARLNVQFISLLYKVLYTVLFRLHVLYLSSTVLEIMSLIDIIEFVDKRYSAL